MYVYEILSELCISYTKAAKLFIDIIIFLFDYLNPMKAKQDRIEQFFNLHYMSNIIHVSLLQLSCLPINSLHAY